MVGMVCQCKGWVLVVARPLPYFAGSQLKLHPLLHFLLLLPLHCPSLLLIAVPLLRLSLVGPLIVLQLGPRTLFQLFGFGFL